MCEKEAKKRINNRTIIITEEDITRIKEVCHRINNSNGIIILRENMDWKKRRIFFYLLKKRSDLIGYTIVDNGEKCIVIRQRFINCNTDVDYTALYYEAGNNYSLGKYELALEQFKQVLLYGKNTHTLYGKMALCLIKLNRIDEALDFLLAAKNFSISLGTDFGYDKLISELRAPKEEIYESLETTSDFSESDMFGDEYFGIPNFEELNEFICENGLDIESSCRALFMNDDKINRVILVYAKLFYRSGHMEMGDKFVRVVEQQKNKSKEVAGFIRELKNNKILYKNSRSVSQIPFKLSLKPKNS